MCKKATTMSHILFFIVFILTFYCHGISTQHLQSIQLEQLKVNKDAITLSGFSSGGTFAQQLQISHSKLFSGIAVFSHTFYGCGPGDGKVVNYDRFCTTLGNTTKDRLYDPQEALKKIERYHAENLIENPRHLRGKHLYVYTGLRNSLFTPKQSLRILRIYEPYIEDPQKIRTRVQDAELVLPSDTFGGECTKNAEDTYFIANCGLSGAFESIQFLIGHHQIARPVKKANLRRLFAFDQTRYLVEGYHGMDNTGYVFIPRYCGKGFEGLKRACYLHFYFHGCLTGRNFLGADHVINSGFLEVAERNNMIVVFPQIKSDETNKFGCWDTYGYTNKYFATRRGLQVQIVRAMIDRILGDGEDYDYYRPDSQEAAANLKNFNNSTSA